MLRRAACPDDLENLNRAPRDALPDAEPDADTRPGTVPSWSAMPEITDAAWRIAYFVGGHDHTYENAATGHVLGYTHFDRHGRCPFCDPESRRPRRPNPPRPADRDPADRVPVRFSSSD